MRGVGNGTNRYLVARFSCDHQDGVVTDQRTRGQKLDDLEQEILKKHPKVNKGDVFTSERTHHIVIARRELFYEARLRYNWSLTTMARMVHKHHTVVRHAIIQHCIHNGLPTPAGIDEGRVYRSTR